jgi:hypothetical protein
MDWNGPNASVAAGNALLDKRIGEDIQDVAKHVYQLAQGLRSIDGTDTGLTGFDMEFAVRRPSSCSCSPTTSPTALSLPSPNSFVPFSSLYSTLRSGVKSLTAKRRSTPLSAERTCQRIAMSTFYLVRCPQKQASNIASIPIFPLIWVPLMLTSLLAQKSARFTLPTKPMTLVWSWSARLAFLDQTTSTPITFWYALLLKCLTKTSLEFH